MIRLYYIFKLIFRGLRLRPWGSILTLISCWFALCQLALVFYTVDIADRISAMPATSGSMMAYLKDSPEEDRIAEINKSISALSSVANVKYISRQEGLSKIKQWLGPESALADGVDSQILPDAFEIVLKREYADKVADIADAVSKIKGVESVHFRKGLIGYIAGAFPKIVTGASIIGTIVLVCLALVIFLSIRVGIVSRGQEIEVMRMLGASFLFIYAPYLIEALAYSLLGSASALGTAYYAINYLNVNFVTLQSFLMPLNLNQVAGVILFACFSSILGALLAIKRSIDV